MKTCKGYWPDPGTPCQRILSAGDHCPKSGDPDHGYYADRSLDPRWDWCNIQTLRDPEPVWIKAACKHLDPEPVMVTDLVTGDQILVARLCTDCDTQLETDWTRDQLPEPNGYERWLYGDLVFVNGPAVNKRVPVQPTVAARTGRVLKLALVWYWERYVDVWEAMKKSVDRFLDSLGYMWPVYLVMINFAWKAIHG